MFYSVQKYTLPWARLVVLETPYLFEQVPVAAKTPVISEHVGVPVSAMPQIVCVVDTPRWRHNFIFVPNEFDQLEKFLRELEVWVTEQVMTGQARPKQLSKERVNVERLSKWVMGETFFSRLAKRPVFSKDELGIIEAGNWRLSPRVRVKPPELSPSYRFARKAPSRNRARPSLVSQWYSTVIPTLYRTEEVLPPAQRRVARVLKNLGVHPTELENGRVERAVLESLWKSFLHPVSLGDIIRPSSFHRVLLGRPEQMVLGKEGVWAGNLIATQNHLLHITLDHGRHVLVVAQGETLQLVGQARIDSRRRFAVLNALIELGVAVPHHYEGQLARAQEHPALELRRRRSFADGTVLYERRLLGSVVDYVAVRGRSVKRGLSPRHALSRAGG